MKKYVERIQEFEAYQFDGTQESGNKLQEWVFSNFGVLRFDFNPTGQRGLPEVYLKINDAFVRVYKLNWVMLVDRNWIILDPEQFSLCYMEADEVKEKTRHHIMADNEVIRMGEGT